MTKLFNDAMTQDEIMLRHLRRSTITQAEARRLYRIEQPARCVWSLRNLGYDITSTPERDLTGRRYVRYSLGA